MPGLLRLASTHKADTGWVFNFRDTSAYDIDSDSELIEDRTTVVANKRTSHAQLLKELDLSAREDTAVYKPNPWSISKLNSACRPSSCASFAAPINANDDSTESGTLSTTATTTNRRSSSASFINKNCRGVSRKSVQTTLDKLFTVEKAGISPKRTLSKTTQLPFKYDKRNAFTSVTRNNGTDKQPATASFNKSAVVDTSGTNIDEIKATLSSYRDEISGLPTENEVSNPPSSINSISSVLNDQENQKIPDMLPNYMDHLSEYSVETNDNPENSRTELLDTDTLDTTTASDWTRTLEHLLEELMPPYSHELDHIHGHEIIEPVQSLPSDYADLIPIASSIRNYSNLSDHNSHEASLLPSFSSVERSPLRSTYFNNSTVHSGGLNARPTRRIDGEDPDLIWSTLPSRHRKKPVKTKTYFKNSGKFKLPSLPSCSTKSIATDTAIVDSTTEKLSNGKQLTFYKPPSRKQFDLDDRPVILRVRKGNHQDRGKGA